MEKTHFELDVLAGGMGCLVEEFEALKVQAGWTTQSFSENFNRDGLADRDRLIGTSHHHKIEMVNLYNLISFFDSRLQDFDKDLNKLLKEMDKQQKNAQSGATE